MYRDVETVNFCGIVLHPEWTPEDVEEEIKRLEEESAQLTEWPEVNLE